MRETKPQRKVLFLTYGGGHVSMIVPVLHRLKRRDDIEIRVVGLTTAKSVLTAAGIPCLGFKDFVRAGDEDALRDGEKLLSDMGSADLVDRDESIAYLGLNFKDLRDSLGDAEAEEAYRSEGRSSFFPKQTLLRYLREELPDLVVTTNAPRSEKALLQAAAELRIPSVSLIDLFDGPRFQSDFSKRGYATKICVLSESVKRYLVSLGQNADSVVVTGNPAFDVLASPTLEKLANELRANRGWSNCKVIVWAVENGQKNEISMAIRDELLKLSRIHPKWRIVFRPHPNSQIDFGPIPNGVFISERSEPISVLLKAADAVLLENSTVGLEAAILGKLLVQIRCFNQEPVLRYADNGWALALNLLDDLESVIARAGAGSNPAIADLASCVGRAAQNVEDVIAKLLGTAPNKSPTN